MLKLLALAGVAGVAASEDLALNVRILTANATNSTGPTASEPYKINLAVPIKFSADIGNMTVKDFVGQMASSKTWIATTTDELFSLLKSALTGLKKSEIQDVTAVVGSRRARRARALAAKDISYETKFSVVPDYSAGAPSYMTALNKSGSSSMSLKDKLINELAAVVSAAVKDGSFAKGALKALQAAAKDPTFAAALAAAGAPADAISKLKSTDLTVSEPKMSDGYGGAAFTTDGSYVPALATTTKAPMATTSNAVAAGIAALLASVALL